MKPERISVSFSKKFYDQELLAYLKTKKEDFGISDYIKFLIKKDMEENKDAK